MRSKGKAREVQVEGAQDKRADPSGREHSKPLGGDKLLPVASCTILIIYILVGTPPVLLITFLSVIFMVTLTSLCHLTSPALLSCGIAYRIVFVLVHR